MQNLPTIKSSSVGRSIASREAKRKLHARVSKSQHESTELCRKSKALGVATTTQSRVSSLDRYTNTLLSRLLDGHSIRHVDWYQCVATSREAQLAPKPSCAPWAISSSSSSPKASRGDRGTAATSSGGDSCCGDGSSAVGACACAMPSHGARWRPQLAHSSEDSKLKSGTLTVLISVRRCEKR